MTEFGLEIGGRGKSRCSICGKEWLDCDHDSGVEYDGEICVQEIYEFDLTEISVVEISGESWRMIPKAQTEGKSDD